MGKEGTKKDKELGKEGPERNIRNWERREQKENKELGKERAKKEDKKGPKADI
jgi:hypothetical protein